MLIKIFEMLSILLHPISYFVDFIVIFITSEAISNLSTVISGLTVVFGLLIWKIQKRHEMKAEIANKALDFLDDFKNEIDLILQFIYCVREKNGLSDKDLKISIKGIPLEAKEYLAYFDKTIQKLTRSKNLALRLNNTQLNDLMKNLQAKLKPFPGMVQGINWHTNDVQLHFRNEVSYLTVHIENYYTQIHALFVQYILLNNSFINQTTNPTHKK